jgi:hypothetical protein
MAKYVNALFGTLAALGLTASVVVHALAVLGHPVQDVVPGVWGLHLGIFVVGLPTVFVLRKKRDSNDPFAFMRGLPSWAVVLLVSLVVYAFINMSITFPSLIDGSAVVNDGQYVLVNKGAVIRPLTEDEFVRGRALMLRGFSGHWMVFYWVAAATLLLRRPTE